MTVKTASGKILEDQPEQGIDGYGGEDFERRKVLRREWKAPRESSTNVSGSGHDDGQKLGDDDGLN